MVLPAVNGLSIESRDDAVFNLLYLKASCQVRPDYRYQSVNSLPLIDRNDLLQVQSHMEPCKR